MKKYIYLILLGILILFASYKYFVINECEPDVEATESSFFIKENRPGLVIFVHGIFGDAKDTWMNIEKKEYYPQIIADDSIYKNYDVFTFGYNSPRCGESLNISQLSDNLLQTFKDRELYKYEKIVFICHSMGGLITRAFLEDNRKIRDVDDIAAKVKLLFFYSTPTEGSQIANWARHFSKNSALKDMSTDEGERILEVWLDRWINDSVLREIPSYSAYEKLKTNSIQVVLSMGSRSLINRRATALEYNHIDMVKPKSTFDMRYIIFRNAFIDLGLEKDEFSKIRATKSDTKTTKKDTFTTPISKEYLNNKKISNYKVFLTSIIEQLNRAKLYHQDYYKDGRDCDKLQKVYQNNIVMHEYMKSRMNYVRESGAEPLLNHLNSWISAYETSFQSNLNANKSGYKVEFEKRTDANTGKSSCVVNASTQFPDGIESKLKGLLEAVNNQEP